jgi:hypothetical protein
LFLFHKLGVKNVAYNPKRLFVIVNFVTAGLSDYLQVKEHFNALEKAYK